jgi:N-sulfoglucosamine sulfohydrolase
MADMNKIICLKTQRLFVLLALVILAIAAPLEAVPKPPNILWITCEDMSPDLGCYGDVQARTPHLDAFARESVRYTHAFATAPACSPARSTLITGIYATSLNTQNLRSNFPVPKEFKGFPSYLRAAGYYCSNNHKTDYNLADERAFVEACWNESSAKSHWRNRSAGQSFFSVFNLMETHQGHTSASPFDDFEKFISARLKAGERHDPAKVVVPPYYPDTPTVRRTLARYYDCITAMDKQVGRILKELEEDGLAEETIVFFFSDHGAGLPRGKRTLYDSGTRVPMLVRFPEQYKHLQPAAPGQTIDQLVSFIDFAPTILNVAGTKIPQHMMGHPFLGSSSDDEREFVFGARDRVDEAFDLSRSARDHRYLYIRNYMPHLSWNQPEGYSDQSEMRREITQLAAEGKLNAAQLTYAGSRKPIEELYDTESDPHQIRNLAAEAGHRATLEKMRTQLRNWIIDTRDVGFLPEQDVWFRLQGDAPWTMARDSKRYPLQRVFAAAELAGRSDAVTEQLKLLRDADSGVGFWAALGLRTSGDASVEVKSALKKALIDPSAAVRIESAAALIQRGDTTPALAVLTKQLKGEDLDAMMHAARTLQLLGDKARPALSEMKDALAQSRKTAKKDGRFLYVRFSLEPAIQKLESSH